MLYEEGAAGAFTPIVRNIRVERLKVEKAAYALSIRTLDRSPLQGLIVRDSVFRGVTKGNRVEGIVDLVLENVTVEPARVSPAKR